MKKKLIILCVACVLLVCLSVVLIVALHTQNKGNDWQTYNKMTDDLFWSLAASRKTEAEIRAITGLIGVPWVQYEDDTIDGNSEMPAKRYLQVDIENEALEAYVVTYYAPGVTQKGFGGVFRQYPRENNGRFLSTSIAYVPGIIVQTFVFAKDETNADINALVTRELGLMAEIQNILEQIK